jgi:hypothetical protein
MSGVMTINPLLARFRYGWRNRAGELYANARR